MLLIFYSEMHGLLRSTATWDSLKITSAIASWVIINYINFFSLLRCYMQIINESHKSELNWLSSDWVYVAMPGHKRCDLLHNCTYDICIQSTIESIVECCSAFCYHNQIQFERQIVVLKMSWKVFNISFICNMSEYAHVSR